MANYTTNTSDKKKKTALVFWFIGLVGLLGLEYIYVGKIKKGIVRIVIGLIFSLGIYAIITQTQTGPVWLIFWAILALPNFIKILLGTFQDNVGTALRK